MPALAAESLRAVPETDPGDSRPIASEAELATVAARLAGNPADWTAAERCLADAAPPACPMCPMTSARQVESVRQGIVGGADPLADAFCRLRTAAARRGTGAVYTPHNIVRAMVGWIAATHRQPARIVDPGAGSGRFIARAAEVFPLSELVAVESDPLAALMLRANADTLGFGERLRLFVGDYRDLSLPPIQGATAFIGNPPYVRHHGINASRKQWLSDAAASLGIHASQLAGLHIHFFFKTALLGRDGDLGCFITAAEWLDVNYGAALRKLFLGRLGGAEIRLLAAAASAFPDTATTAAIACFRIGTAAPALALRHARTEAELMSPAPIRAVARASLAQSERWTSLILGGATMATTKSTTKSTTNATAKAVLGDLFRVHRGQVTGANQVWIAGPAAAGLPPRCLLPAVTRARELFLAGDALTDDTALRRVVELPKDLGTLPAEEREAIDDFLRWASSEGADQGYIARHRRPWWSVGLREPAPILCTYMARRPPAFVRNRCAARHINIAHGLYPRAPIEDDVLSRLLAWLQDNVTLDGGRTYAGGLVKFEPREIERLQIPDLDLLQDPAAPLVTDRKTWRRRRHNG